MRGSLRHRRGHRWIRRLLAGATGAVRSAAAALRGRWSTRRVLAGAAAGALSAGAAVLALVGLGADFHTVGSSTGAWITGYVQGVLDVGDFAMVSNLGRIPNTQLNLVFPGLMAALAWLTRASPVLVGHLLAAGGLGLAALLLGRLWALGRDPIAGVLAAAAFAWPPAVATGALIRPDSLAFSGVIACVLLGVRLARGGAWQVWLGAGVLLGLTHQTREYLVAPAAGALAAGWALALARSGRGARALPAMIRVLWLFAGVGLSSTLPLALGFLPWNGLSTLLAYSRQSGSQGYGIAALLYLPALGPVWLLGAGGLAAAAWRGAGPRRDAALVQVGALLPWAAFLLSRQQSPQYYVLAEALLLAGWVGWLDLVPTRGPRWAAATILMFLGLSWSLPRARALVDGQPESYRPRLHQEAWPARGSEVAAVVDWAWAQVGQRPLVVVSRYIENLGEVFMVRHARPVITLRDEGWTDEVGDLRRFHQGREIAVLTVGGPHHPAAAAPGCVADDSLTTEALLATLYRCDGTDLPAESRRRDYPCVDWFGACQQLDWLAGGLERLRQRARDPGPEFAGGVSPGILPWDRGPGRRP